jgi:hypothetical protein
MSSRQSKKRQSHLSTVDFATLDVILPEQVADLNYHEDDRPRRLWESRAAKWSQTAASNGEYIKGELTARLHWAVERIATMSKELETDISGKEEDVAGQADKVKETLRAIEMVKLVSAQMSDMADEKMKDQLKGYLGILGSKVGSTDEVDNTA